MGILNVTPDSFFDGGEHLRLDDAVAHGLRMADAGADIIDVGGESTRPGSLPVDPDTELERVVPVIERLAAEVDVPISIDTTKPEVAEAALAAGATLLNDVSGLRVGPELAEVAAAHGASMVLMHSRATPKDMQDHTRYHDVVGEVRDFLAAAADLAVGAGVPRDRIILDPGIGFAKDLEGNLALLKNLDELVALGHPVLLGPSRKSFIGAITGLPVEQRLGPTIAVCAVAVMSGVRILRVHDVAEVLPAVQVADALRDTRTTRE